MKDTLFKISKWALLLQLHWLLIISCATTPDPEVLKMAEAHNKLGASYLENGRLNEAFVEFQKTISLDKNNKEAYNYLGYISMRFGKYDDAISYFKKAISIDRNYSEAINNLGVVYAQLERWDDAIEQFKKALSNPTYKTPEWAYLNMGYAYYRKGEYDKAEDAVKDALIRNPIFPRAIYTLGLIYKAKGDYDSAINQFKKAVGIMPDYIDAHWELANLYIELGKKAKAIKHLRTVIEKDVNETRIKKATDLINSLKY